MSFGFGYGLGFGGYSAKYDNDAQNYFDYFSDLPVTYKNAVNIFVTELKKYGLWQKLKYGLLCPITLDDTKTVLDLKTATILSGAKLEGQSSTGNRSAMCCTTPIGFRFIIAEDRVETGAIASAIHIVNDMCIVHNSLFDNGTGSTNFYGANQGSSNTWVLTPRSGTNTLTQRWYSNTNNSGSNQITGITSDLGDWVSSRRSLTDAEIYNNGVSIASFANGGGGLPNVQFFLGGQNNAGVISNERAHTCLFHLQFSGLTDSEVTNLKICTDNYKSNINVSTITRNLIWDGNSLSVYENKNAMRAALYYSFNNNKKTYKWENKAIGGQTTASMISDYATEIAPLYNATYYNNIYVMWEGRNDFYNGHSAADVKINILALKDLAISTGFTVIIPICSATKFTGNIGGLSETNYNLGIDEINQYIMSLHNGTTVYSIDLTYVGVQAWRSDYASDADYNTALTNIRTTYTIDETHLTKEGYRLVGYAIATQALDLIG